MVLFIDVLINCNEYLTIEVMKVGITEIFLSTKISTK